MKLDSAKNIALLGSKKTGKTSLIKQHFDSAKNLVPVYIDLNKISLNPENFSIELISNFIFQFFGKWRHENDLDSLIKAVSLKNNFVDDSLSLIKNETEKIKPNQKLIVEAAFNLVNNLSKDKKTVIYLDNFENILNLNNFSQIKDILSFFDFNNKNVKYVVSSSSIFTLSNILKKYDFEIIKIDNLDKKESELLIKSLITADEKIVDEIFNLTQGHPFLIKNLCRRYKEVKNVRKSFIIELTHVDSPSYNFFDTLLKDLLNRARGASLLKTIIHALCFEDNLRLTDISKKIYRSAPVTKSLLERLIEADLISKINNKYTFNDSNLKLWLKLSLLGHEFYEIPQDTIFKEIEALLNE